MRTYASFPVFTLRLSRRVGTRTGRTLAPNNLHVLFCCSLKKVVSIVIISGCRETDLAYLRRPWNFLFSNNVLPWSFWSTSILRVRTLWYVSVGRGQSLQLIKQSNHSRCKMSHLTQLIRSRLILGWILGCKRISATEWVVVIRVSGTYHIDWRSSRAYCSAERSTGKLLAESLSHGKLSAHLVDDCVLRPSFRLRRRRRGCTACFHSCRHNRCCPNIVVVSGLSGWGSRLMLPVLVGGWRRRIRVSRWLLMLMLVGWRLCRRRLHRITSGGHLGRIRVWRV